MKRLAIVIGQLSLSAVSIVLNGWAFSILWGWFIVTTFGVMPITIPAAIGLGFVVSYLTKQAHCKVDTSNEAIWYDLRVSVMKPFVALGIGWIVKGFM
jgi:hypothetical protein